MNLESQLTKHFHGDSSYTHQGGGTSKKVLIAAVCLTLGYALVEAVGGFLSNSLALISDAGHMVTDSASLLFALAANLLQLESIHSVWPRSKYWPRSSMRL